MKKVIFAIMASAALTFSCNDNRSSEVNDNDDGVQSEETLEPSTEESDTTSTWDQDRDRQHDDEMKDSDGRKDSDELDDDETDARRDTASTRDDGTIDNQR